MRFSSFSLALLLGIMILPLSAAKAQLSVEPLFLEVAPGQSAAVRVRNTGDTTMTVELEVTRRDVDESGTQTRTPADDDFILVPPQGAIPPQGSQVFRLQPLPSGSSTSQSYFMTVRQIPVAMEEIPGGGAQVQVVFAFDVAVHVVPRGAESQLELISAAPSTMMIDADPQPQEPPAPGTDRAPRRQIEVPAVEMAIRNDGTKYLYLQDFDFVATGVNEAGSRVELPRWDRQQIINAAAVTFVEPGATRIFKLPLLGGQTLRSVQVEIRQRPLA